MSDATPMFNSGSSARKPSQPRNAMERFFREARIVRESRIQRALHLIERDAISSWKAREL